MGIFFKNKNGLPIIDNKDEDIRSPYGCGRLGIKAIIKQYESI